VRFLILSDVHSNWEALEAVLNDAAGQYDRILCCGDIVGYCADPNRVAAWFKDSGAAVVRGNHDKACAGLDDLEWFNPVARASATWTQQHLGDGNLEYLRALPQGPLFLECCQVVHGSPVDEDEYLVSLVDADQARDYLSETVTFFGHTHLQGGFCWGRGGARALPKVPSGRREQELPIDPDGLYLINPGSVGQPRDRDRRAAYALYTPQDHLVTLRRAEYDVAAAARKILAAGLPELLALRIELGQ
jgi:diadenosine tetraphosphatase ApaH/serine/threonine PP2A family protein phosphatase